MADSTAQWRGHRKLAGQSTTTLLLEEHLWGNAGCLRAGSTPYRDANRTRWTAITHAVAVVLLTWDANTPPGVIDGD